MWNRQSVKEMGLSSMKRNYWNSVLVAFITALFAGTSAGVGRSVGNSSSWKEDLEATGSSFDPSSIDLSDPQVVGVLMIVLGVLGVVGLIAFLLGFFVFNPLTVGCNRFFVRNQYENAAVGELGFAFKNNYKNSILAMFLRGLLIGLGYICFIVPGVILSYSYKMVPYILGEETDLGPVEVLKKSRAMMQGHKWNCFVFELSYIGWRILALFTCGILNLFYVSPYFYNAYGALYIQIRDGFNGYSQPEVVNTPVN